MEGRKIVKEQTIVSYRLMRSVVDEKQSRVKSVIVVKDIRKKLANWN